MQAEVGPRDLMLRTTYTKTLRDGRKAIVMWSVGLALTVLMYAAFWPSVHTNANQFSDFVQKLPEAFRNMMGGADFGTPVGYVQTELLSMLGPALLLVFAIGAGARAIAGEEESGALDLLLSTPVRRRRVLLDMAGGMATATGLLAVAMWLSLVVVSPLFDLSLPGQGLAAATLNLFLLAMAFGSLSLLIGAAGGSKGAAIGVSGGLVVTTFVLNTLAPTVHLLRPLRVLSPFHYYSGHQPLSAGFNGTDILVLAAISGVCIAAAVAMFDRRDLAA